MEIVPVIDLKGGIVVHARRGERANYAPITTPLSPTASPIDVGAGLMRLSRFSKLYVADLDAIAGNGEHESEIGEIAAAYPDLDIWTDRGSATADDVERWLNRGHGTLVLGSESQRDVELVLAFRDDPRIVLSLDFRDDEFQGPPALLEDASLWPERIIVMTLARVGGASGPDFMRLRSILAKAEGRRVFAAGGLRHMQDGLVLRELGITGILTASALHSGALTREEIEMLK